MAHPIDTLHGFLVSWLSFHILGEDQAMARALVRIQQGMNPAEAHETDGSRGERSTAALLNALQHLYALLSQQNQDLAKVNAELESRVKTRTSELDGAYAKLAAEHQELTELLSKVDQVQGQLLQSEKMASVGQLAAGVAHEINNPIGFVTSNLRTLERYVEQLLRLAELGAHTTEGQAIRQEVDLPFLREDLGALLAESNDGLERVRKIVANLKDFSHVDEAEWQDADLLAGVESTLNVVWHELKFKTDIVRELSPLPLVRCIPAQINQVVMNLLLNAVQAIPEHGTITLRSGVDNEQAWLEIADTGTGMSEDVKRRMFEPFFTTKPVGKGTGLGMSLTYDIIRKHAGSIDVTSTLGVGTCFRIWLPITGPSAN
jgi:signal transduction histidine kinase